MFRQQKKKQKKRKRRMLDPIKLEEIARKVAAIKAKRDKVIDEVHQSLNRRREEKQAIQNAHFEKEARARRKAARDAEKEACEKTMLQIREDLSGIIETGIKCVYTSVIIPEKIKYDGRRDLTIKGVKYRLKRNLHMVGWGKEAITMSSALERIVGRQLRKGFMVVPRKSIFMMWSFPEAFPRLDSRISYTEAGTRGQPDEKSVTAGRKILEYCKKLKKKDLLIVMLSPDIDDLLCCPNEFITIKDKIRVLQRLKMCKATEEEINLVRNKLSDIRGGDLARTAYPARIITLITSDISAEPDALLAGGPCIYDPKNERAWMIVNKYGLADKIPQSMRELLEEVNPWTMAADKQLDDKKNYKFVHRYVIACNADAMECMAVEAFRLGLIPLKLNSICLGEVQEFAMEYAKLTSLMILAVEDKIDKLEFFQAMRDSPICPLTDKKVQDIFPAKEKWGLGLCMMLGGRTRVNLCPEPGTGGPNQELALYFSLYWFIRTEQYPILRGYTVWFLGGSSYGKDGNTEAVGAFGYKSLATDVYPEFQRVNREYKDAHHRWWRLTEDGLDEMEILLANKEMKECELERKKYENLLPESVLQQNNTNFLFRSINDEDELLELKTGNYYTFTDVGDIHIIRITRFQCNCVGLCHGLEERTCADKECTVNRTMSAQVHPTLRYCCRVGAPKQR